MIFKIIIVLLITALGMVGGQCKKWTRRFIMPSLATIYTIISKEKKNKIKGLYYLLLMGIISLGYGTDSWLRKVLGGSDTLTRLVYGLLVSIPFIFFGKWYACIALPAVWSIRAGGFKLPNGKDWLWEDFARYSCLGVLVVI